MRVLLPAPFSPRSAWISPGSTVRSMWSLATRPPNLFVMPRSSSFTAYLRGDRTAPARAEGEGCGPPPPRSVGHVGVWPTHDHFGALGVSTGMEPLMMPALMVASSDCTLAGTLLWNWWNGARPVPPLARVPM